MIDNNKKIVVLGVGNTLLKDEGVGVKVVEELSGRFTFPDHVDLVDGGTQGLWLLATLQQADHLIVVDAVLGKGPPGTLYRLEKEDLPKQLRVKVSAHDSDLVEALNLCELIEKGPETVVVVGIEPEDIEPFGLDLTPTIAGKKEEMIQRVLDELKSLGVEPQESV